jgi:glyoxylase-like metal-dependent hydrolase (beta-lactamase superfamily II)/8-oxo-dGTP pyrophosphatase MutT (NUDIX family)
VTHAGVEPRLAATVVLLRPGRAGLEVLLTRRPASMAFAPDMHVFPGGRVDAADGDPRLIARSVVSPRDAARALGGDLEPGLAIAAYIAAVREVLEETGVLLADGGASRAISQARSALVGGEADFASIVEELDLTLRTDLLVPLSRWVTPPVLPRRFDARFFAALLPAGARVSFEGDEVAGHAWMTPRAALDAMAGGDVAMWIPTSATLQQLERVVSIDQIRERLAPGVLVEPRAEIVSPEVTRIVMPAGGGVPGQSIAAYLVGRSRFVLVDPGDPIGPGLDLAIAAATARGGTIEAIALTQIAPDHAAGAEGLSEMLGGVPILGGPGAGASLPYAVELVSEDTLLASGDVPIRAVPAPGPAPEHLAFLVGDSFLIAGDLDGPSGARSVAPPPDMAAIATSSDRLRALAPAAMWLSSHPVPEPA